MRPSHLRSATTDARKKDSSRAAESDGQRSPVVTAPAVQCPSGERRIEIQAVPDPTSPNKWAAASAGVMLAATSTPTRRQTHVSTHLHGR
jgi:hypothetical protein